MASPQCENGYVKIANELWDALTKTRIRGEEMQVLMAILRKTYGYNKKQDSIPISQLERMTGLSRQSVCRALRGLQGKNLITSDKNATRTPSTYAPNKDYERWLPSDKIVTSDKNATSLPSDTFVSKLVTKLRPSKDNIQKTKEKEGMHEPENGSRRQQPKTPRTPCHVNLSEDYLWVGITEIDMKRWIEAYPACDVRVELARAAEYIRANPTKRKTNWLRYVSNWLNRSQNYGGTHRGKRKDTDIDSWTPPKPTGKGKYD